MTEMVHAIPGFTRVEIIDHVYSTYYGSGKFNKKASYSTGFLFFI